MVIPQLSVGDLCNKQRRRRITLAGMMTASILLCAKVHFSVSANPTYSGIWAAETNYVLCSVGCSPSWSPSLSHTACFVHFWVYQSHRIPTDIECRVPRAPVCRIHSMPHGSLFPKSLVPGASHWPEVGWFSTLVESCILVAAKEVNNMPPTLQSRW